MNEESFVAILKITELTIARFDEQMKDDFFKCS